MKLFQVDAFAEKAFQGNPAAVCLLEEDRDATWRQQLAEEMNLAETAFLLKRDDGYDLRWFTPKFEVDLCGHATLASAHILWQQQLIGAEEEAVFHTKSGRLTANKDGDWITLNFPEEKAEPCEMPDIIKESLQIEAVFAGKNRMDYLIELESAEVLRNLKPDFNTLINLETRGVIVTSTSDDPSYDFLSRFFAPWHGINEDPVTGSAHCCTGPYWKDKLGKEELTAYQASERGGLVKIAFDNGRVLLSGKAVTIMEAELLGM